MPRPTLDPATLQVGEALPRYERQFTEVDLMAYGAATWDWHRLHYDHRYAQSKGLPAPVIDGQVYGAMFARVATDWAGPGAFLSRLQLQMKSMAFAGDCLRISGEVTELNAAESAGWIVRVAQRLHAGERLIAQASTELRWGGAAAVGQLR